MSDTKISDLTAASAALGADELPISEAGTSKKLTVDQIKTYVGAKSVATDVLWDAAGDLAVGSGADTAAKLSKGADGTVLTISASTHVPVWAAPTGGGAMATDPLWDAAGDLAVGTGADTAGKLTLTVPAANILEVLGVVNGETTPTWKPIHDGTAPSTQAFGDSAAAGTALTAAHRDHKHAMPALGTATPIVESGAGTAGTAVSASHEDHVHPGAFATATPALTLGTTNATGSATTALATDATILAFDATAPSTQAFGDSAAVGAATVAARRDHKHAMPALGTTAAAVGTSAGGSATTPSKSDHVHATGAGTPSTQAFGDSAATGTGPAAAMTDHKHAMPALLDLWVGPFDPRLCGTYNVTIPTANKAMLCAFQVNHPITVTKARTYIGQATSGNIDLGIYDATFHRLASTGSTAASGTWSTQTINLTGSLALVPGVKYWASIAADNATITVRAALGAGPGPQDSDCLWYGEVATSFPLPAGPLTLAAGTTQNFAVVFLA